MKSFFRFALLTFTLALMPIAARAQTIGFPQPNQQVRGTIRVTFEGVPEGGYAMIYLDGTGMQNLREATAESFYLLNTFTLPEGQHTLTAVFFNAGGKRAGKSDVTFEVANSSVDASAEGVKLRVWTNNDILNDVVRRYRVFAESNVSVEGGSGGGMGGGGGAMGGGAVGGAAGGLGGGAGEDTWIPAPLDWQLDMLIRSVVRDVGLTDGAANIRSIVQEAYQRQRISEQGGGGAGGAAPAGGAPRKRRKRGQKPSSPTKAPWGDWGTSPDTGRYFVKTVLANGDEINATRKIATLAVGDLLPRFPQATVRPGSTWESEMAIVGEIPVGVGVNVRAPMTFVSFENIQTPMGVERRCAKLEARFQLPLEVATRIGRAIQKQAGTGRGAGGAGAIGAAQATTGVGAPGAGGAAVEEEPIDFKTVSTSVTREIWFDIAGNQVLRSTDSVATYYEEEVEEVEGGAMGGGAIGGGALGGALGGDGAAAAPQEGTKVSYNLRISKYLDDTPPPPSDTFNGGANTAHSRDNVRDPSLAKLEKR